MNGDHIKKPSYVSLIFFRSFIVFFSINISIAVTSGMVQDLSDISAIQDYISAADSIYLNEEFESAMALYEKALKMAKKEEQFGHQAYLNNKIGSCLSLMGKDKESLAYFHEAIHFANLIKDDTIKGDALNNLGVAIGYTGLPDSAIYYFEKALKIREQLNDSTSLAATYRNTAEVLRVLRRLDKAESYCRKAYQLIPGIKNFRITANIYNEIAYLYELTNQLDSAEYFYKKLIEISENNNFNRGKAVGYSNLASVYELEKRYDEALDLKMLGLKLDMEIGHVYGIMTSYHVIATCYIGMGNYISALQYLDSAAMLCDSSWINDLQGLERSKYLAYKGLGNYKKALVHYESSSLLKDSIFNEKKRKNIAEILTRYETEKKEQQIEILSKTTELQTRRNRIQLLILVVVILISISGATISWLIIKNKNHRIKQMDLELRNYLLRLNEYTENNDESANTLNRLKSEFGLTQREAEILEHISQGHTNAELSEKLFVSENTIKYHIKNIYIKLDVKNRVQALQRTAFSHQSN